MAISADLLRRLARRGLSCAAWGSRVPGAAGISLAPACSGLGFRVGPCWLRERRRESLESWCLRWGSRLLSALMVPRIRDVTRDSLCIHSYTFYVFGVHSVYTRILSMYQGLVHVTQCHSRYSSTSCWVLRARAVRSAPGSQASRLALVCIHSYTF